MPRLRARAATVRAPSPTDAPRRNVPATWPLPALGCWTLAWAACASALAAGAGPAAGLAAGVAAGAMPLAWLARRGLALRRLLIAGAGFPLSAAVLGLVPALPGWAWLVALLPLLALYPLRAWRDAPLFPTPRGALEGLAAKLPEPPRRVLDAGCGAGDALRALAAEFPGADRSGIEWSWPLVWLSRLRGRGARVRRADMWASDWSGFDLVYLFQRPESMARAMEKARAELPAGAWLASLEFPVPGVLPSGCLQRPGAKAVWLYRMPEAAAVRAAPGGGSIRAAARR